MVNTALKAVDVKTLSMHMTVPGKPRKVREFDSGQGKVRENVLPVLCYCDCDGHRISIA